MYHRRIGYSSRNDGLVPTVVSQIGRRAVQERFISRTAELTDEQVAAEFDSYHEIEEMKLIISGVVNNSLGKNKDILRALSSQTPSSPPIGSHVKRFRSYLVAQKQPSNIELRVLDQAADGWLAEWLGSFYAEVLQYNGRPYSAVSLVCMRYCLHHFLSSLPSTRLRRPIDILRDPQYARANRILLGRCRAINDEHLKAPVKQISNDDLAKLMGLFSAPSTLSSGVTAQDDVVLYRVQMAIVLLLHFSQNGEPISLSNLSADALVLRVDKATNQRCYVLQSGGPSDVVSETEHPIAFATIERHLGCWGPNAPKMFMHWVTTNDPAVYIRTKVPVHDRVLELVMPTISQALNLSHRYSNACLAKTPVDVFYEALAMHYSRKVGGGDFAALKRAFDVPTTSEIADVGAVSEAPEPKKKNITGLTVRKDDNVVNDDDLKAFREPDPEFDKLAGAGDDIKKPEESGLERKKLQHFTFKNCQVTINFSQK